MLMPMGMNQYSCKFVFQTVPPTMPAMQSKLWHDTPPWTRHWRSQLQWSGHRAVKVLSPCVGLDAPRRSAEELGCVWESTGDYDINVDLLSTLRLFAGTHDALHVGKCSGTSALCHLMPWIFLQTALWEAVPASRVHPVVKGFVSWMCEAAPSSQ